MPRGMEMRSRLALGLVLVGLAGAACGGSTTTGSSPTARSETGTAGPQTTSQTATAQLPPPAAPHGGSEAERVVKGLSSLCKQGEVAVLNRHTRSVTCIRAPH